MKIPLPSSKFGREGLLWKAIGVKNWTNQDYFTRASNELGLWHCVSQG